MVGSTNTPYAYASDNPTNVVDPIGMAGWECAGRGVEFYWPGLGPPAIRPCHYGQGQHLTFLKFLIKVRGAMTHVDVVVDSSKASINLL